MIDDGVLYSHFSDVRDIPWRWKNFTAQELSSNGGGEYYHHPDSLTAIQGARDDTGKAIHVNSGHRSWIHNLAVGGSPRSAHLYIAFDIHTGNHDRFELYGSLRRRGFSSFGFYETFIHADMRLGRMWYGSEEAKRIWALDVEL